MTTLGGSSYGSYDNNGNLTSRGSDAFAWDHENRMTSATVASAQTTYAYNGDGLRQTRTANSVTTTYTWDVAGGLPMLLQDGTNTYVYGATGMLYFVDGSGNPQYRLTDGLGSTAAMANSGGTVTDTWTYDVFGAVRSHSGSSGTEFTFTGEQNDPNGLEYLRARYYDPATGRFVSRDRYPAYAFDPTTLNRYGYVNSNPVNLTDPSGQCFLMCVALAAVAAVMVIDYYQNNPIDWPSVHFFDNDPPSPGVGEAHAIAGAQAGGQFQMTPLDPNDPFGEREIVANGQVYRLTDHAVQRMEERSLSQQMIAETMGYKTPIEIVRDGVTYHGYYNDTAGILIVVSEERAIITVEYGSGVIETIARFIAAAP